jgi:hypothetical protein
MYEETVGVLSRWGRVSTSPARRTRSLCTQATCVVPGMLYPEPDWRPQTAPTRFVQNEPYSPR